MINTDEMSTCSTTVGNQGKTSFVVEPLNAGLSDNMFLAVQNISIGDLVTDSLSHSLSHSLTDGTFTFDIHRATPETCDL